MTDTTGATTTASRDKLWTMIKDIKFGMFTTRHPENGHLHSRPMTTQNKELGADDSLWYFMSRSSHPVEDLATEPTVNVAFADPGSDTWVSVSGEAAVVNDRAKVEQLWSKIDEAWFKGGPQDPDLALVQVRIVHANYWDVQESKIVQLFEMAKAAFTGKPANLGEHGEVRLR